MKRNNRKACFAKGLEGGLLNEKERREGVLGKIALFSYLSTDRTEEGQGAGGGLGAGGVGLRARPRGGAKARGQRGDPIPVLTRGWGGA